MMRYALGIFVAVLVIVLLASCKIKTIGSPIGKSVRVGETIVTMMSRLEPYVPTPNRNHGNDRYTIGLLIHSATDTTARKFVSVATGQRSVDINLMNIIAVEGNVVWYRAEKVGAYDIARKKLMSDEPGWSSTAHAPAKPFPLAELNNDERAILGMMIAGGDPTPTRWLGVLTEDEAARVWSPGSAIWPTMPVERSKEPRRFYSTDTDRGSDGKARIKKLELIGGDRMLNAAFVRAVRLNEILRLAGDGFLLLYESKPNGAGSIMAARVDGAGKIIWTIDTGIGDLREILPDAQSPALIGARPRVPDKVSEPILVVLDATSGHAVTHSLWLK